MQNSPFRKKYKESIFLKKTILELELKNALVINTRIEEKNDLGLFDLITARAFSSISNILRLTKNNSEHKNEIYIVKGHKENNNRRAKRNRHKQLYL